MFSIVCKNRKCSNRKNLVLSLLEGVTAATGLCNAKFYNSAVSHEVNWRFTVQWYIKGRKSRLLELDGRLITDYQSQPRQYNHNGRKCCRFFSTGVRFDFMVSNHPADRESLELFCVKPQSGYICW